MLNACPAVTEPGTPDIVNSFNAPASTVTSTVFDTLPAVPFSVAAPALTSVCGAEPLPSVTVMFASWGAVPFGLVPLLVRDTVTVPEAALPRLSTAPLTDRLNATPAVTVSGAVRVKSSMGAAET